MSKSKRVYRDEDTVLMQKAAMGDQIALAKVCDKYLPIITAYAASINGHTDSPEDIAQEVFLRLLPKIYDYRSTASVKRYLFEYTQNIMQEYHRKPRHQPLADDYIETMTDESDPAAILRQKELAEIIRKAKDKLPAKQRQAAELLYYTNTSIAKAAKSAGCSIKVLHQRVEDAKKRLAVLLRQNRDCL